MSFLQSFVARLRSHFNRNRLEIEMAEEMESHLALRIQANMEAGMSPEEARFAALRSFGHVDGVKEQCRDQRNFRWLEDALQDFRIGLRVLRKSPGFTCVAVLSLAIGIGASTSVFSVLHTVFLRTLPVPHPEELRTINWIGRHATLNSYTGSGLEGMSGGYVAGGSFPYPAYREFRERNRGLSSVFAYFQLFGLTAVARGEAGIAQGLMVSDNFFESYDGRILMGRTLGAEDEKSGAAPVAVITHRCWEQRFGGDAAVLGKTVVLNQRSFTVVGVLAREFVGPLLGDPTEFYVPFSAQPELVPSRPLSSPKRWWVQMMARLGPGANQAEAESSMTVLFGNILSESDTKMEDPRISLKDGSRGPLALRKRLATPLLVLEGIVGMVVLVACANLAGLLLARGAARNHEMSVRAALGARGGRLLRQSLTESLVLSLAGGALGACVAFWGQRAITSTLAVLPFQGGMSFHPQLNVPVLLFTLGISVGTALLFGLLPALQCGRVDPLSGLKSRPMSSSPRLRLGKLLVAMQVALGLVLVVAAGFAVRTLTNLASLDPGFNPANLLVFRMNPDQAGISGDRVPFFLDQVRESLLAIPGVSSVALSSLALGGGESHEDTIVIRGEPAQAGENRHISQIVVSEDFLTTLGIPLLAGRGFAATDVSTGSRVVMVNEAFERAFLKGQTALGKSLAVLGHEGEFYDVVGVCRDTKYSNLREAIPPLVYFCHRQKPEWITTVQVKTHSAPLSVLPAVRKAIATLHPGLPLAEIRTQERILIDSVVQERLFATVCGILAVLAVFLSCIGTYGLITYNTPRRTGEIGIRMALGATRGKILTPILKEALFLAGCGLAAGLPPTLVLGWLVRNQLFGIPPHDLPTFLGAIVVLLGVTVASAWIPAHRASRLSPTEALRTE